jgi:hypothetical protein
MARARRRLSVLFPVLMSLFVALIVLAAPIAADSPVRGHAEVIAQGVAVLPPGSTVWSVALDPVPTNDTTPHHLRSRGTPDVKGRS